MALVLLDLGADEILKTYFNNYRPSLGTKLYLRLFVTDVTPAQTGVTYVQASGGGYQAKELLNGSWTITPGNDPSDAVYAQQVFIFTGALDTNPTIYGYYVEDADGTILWAERLTAAFTPANNGDHVDITPKFQMSSGTPA